MHRVVVACAAKGGEASEEGEGAGVRFDGETEVLAGNFWDDGEASEEWLVVGMRVGQGRTSRSRRDRFALLSGRRLRGQRRGSE